MLYVVIYTRLVWRSVVRSVTLASQVGEQIQSHIRYVFTSWPYRCGLWSHC